jgi:hypothetical protein
MHGFVKAVFVVPNVNVDEFMTDVQGMGQWAFAIVTVDSEGGDNSLVSVASDRPNELFDVAKIAARVWGDVLVEHHDGSLVLFVDPQNPTVDRIAPLKRTVA